MMLAERYRVVRQIGQGGFGTVVLVEDTMVREQLILKFLNPQMAADARMIKRFIHELRYARRVTHENVIRIHDFLRIEKAYAISMEYFPSHSLSAEMPRNTPMDPQRALRILWYICRGMHAAHQVKIIHRDLKPPNVLISDAGVVKIVDFGLAAAVSDTATRLTRTGALLGTPLYMAPEQVQNRKIDVRTDIYSLGIMMYEMFTGRPPYCGNNPMAILYQHLEGKATPPRELNREPGTGTGGHHPEGHGRGSGATLSEYGGIRQKPDSAAQTVDALRVPHARAPTGLLAQFLQCHRRRAAHLLSSGQIYTFLTCEAWLSFLQCLK